LLTARVTELFPTSSLRHEEVALVPQLAQDKAPTELELAAPSPFFFPFVGGFWGAVVDLRCRSTFDSLIRRFGERICRSLVFSLCDGV
jgi:hypothetical protein